MNASAFLTPNLLNTLAKLQALGGQPMNALLQFYGPPTAGLTAEPRVRIPAPERRMCLGLSLLGVHLEA
ncbi:hypothetical protein GPECTOR_7g1249 [Gonium pectorale]|uniref:Uncharacterized protein n=1 Tax=Gonium pectorale TaxID=33097 RepID=A0A150GUD0_GONPE|nr:hypothetical protein GPECTOR_7g1249 [Gonium pectorale]|eukprot:KXZ53353.1 hypothetical protein GPECTOR_7g1249 [Gonium pectorale]